MPFSLRVKLWLGWLFGWDKQGVRVMLFVIVFLVTVTSALVVYDSVVGPVLFPEPPGLTDEQRREFIDWFERQKDERSR